MNTVLETSGLTKRYGRTDALRGCDLLLAGGKVTGLVGPNGAGKTTLLQIAVGLHRPTAGRIRVLGLDPWREGVALLSRVGFVAQDRPLHPGFTVAETLEIGRQLNPRWDHAYALARVKHFGLPLDRPVRSLSTGQRAQVALTLALGKRPEVLLLDEPVANLDPVARLELLEELMGVVAEDGPSVILSSNVLADVERVCEHVVILISGRVRISGDADELVRSHVLVSGPRRSGRTQPTARSSRSVTPTVKRRSCFAVMPLRPKTGPRCARRLSRRSSSAIYGRSARRCLNDLADPP